MRLSCLKEKSDKFILVLKSCIKYPVFILGLGLLGCCWSFCAKMCVIASPSPQATQVEDVYKLEDLAPDDFLAYMEEAATAILTGQQELDPK